MLWKQCGNSSVPGKGGGVAGGGCSTVTKRVVDRGKAETSGTMAGQLRAAKVYRALGDEGVPVSSAQQFVIPAAVVTLIKDVQYYRNVAFGNVYFAI